MTANKKGRQLVAYGDELDMFSTSSRSDSLGVRITSGLGVFRAGSSANAVGWTGLEKWRVAVLQKTMHISLVRDLLDLYIAKAELI